VKCPECDGPIDLPEPKHPAFCPKCDRWFRKVDEHGWFTYVIEIYVPLYEGES
jgi:uncharacterized paraquat-inducible protein A